MTRPSDDHPELRDLLDALCEQAITPEQLLRLEELVLGHPEAEAYYVQYMSLHADLAGCLSALPGPTEQALLDRGVHQTSARPEVGRPRLPPVRAVLAWGSVGLAGMAAGLLLALTFGPRPGGPAADNKPAERVDDTVAVLVQAPEAAWGETELPTRAGSPLPTGWLRLKSGFAHLEFYSGATVILEGPAELQLISRMEAFCASGKLRAVVPQHAQGFSIGSPSLDLIDRGTEFGLQVGGGRTEVHVFSGQVDLYDPGRAGSAPPRRELTTGRGVSLDGPGEPRAIAPDPAAFRTARDLDQRTQAETRKRRDAWRAASAELRKDPSLLVYYPFDAGQPAGRALLDQAQGRRQPRDGTIVGCSWAPGRWPGKRALAFKAVTDRVRLTVPGQFDSLTLAAWVRIDGLPNRNNALLMADGWEEGDVHWQVGDDGTIILGVQSAPKGRGAHYRAYGAITPDRFGQWLHLAVVYDKGAGRVTHYVDGQPVAEERVAFEIPLRVAEAELGSWNLASHRNQTPVRFFTGCIDEFVMFSRPLGEAEVERLHTQGRPPS